MTQPNRYSLPQAPPFVTNIEVHEGSGTGMSSDGVTTLKMFMVDTQLSNGSRGPVVWSAEAFWKLFCIMHDMFGAQFHTMMDTPEYKEFMDQYRKEQGE